MIAIGKKKMHYLNLPRKNIFLGTWVIMFSLAQNYTMLYLMVHSQDFLKYCPSKTGSSIMGDYSPSSVKKCPNLSLSQVNAPSLSP